MSDISWSFYDNPFPIFRNFANKQGLKKYKVLYQLGLAQHPQDVLDCRWSDIPSKFNENKFSVMLLTTTNSSNPPPKKKKNK